MYVELLCLVVWLHAVVFASPTTTVGNAVKLPNTSGLDGQLTANLGVDHFFSFWVVFNNDEVKASDQPFTIFAPQNNATTHYASLLHQPEKVKRLLMDHVVLGSRIDLTNTTEVSFQTLSGRTVHVQHIKESRKLQANGVDIVKPKIVVPNGILVVLADYLFDDYLPKAPLMAANTSTSAPLPTATVKLVNADITPVPLVQHKEDKVRPNSTFIQNILEVLSFLKGVRVFQHFLARSNVSKLLKDGEEYTVFIPTDHAFQRWHPIDWGFYPFSVTEFTESTIVNHFVLGRLKQDIIKDGESIKTLGGKDVVFKKNPGLTVNGAAVVKGDTPVTKGNIMFIGEVLFVNESVVADLHQKHKDKETPPLLAFPWFGAQFLSHSFLALERDRRFSHITRFLNLADLAPHVSGTGYTLFAPVDTAFEELGLDKMPDNYLSTGDGLQILLNHFVKGRLYDRDLKNGTVLNTLGNRTIIIDRKEHIKVNNATVVESEIFVYNLGTMFYIDKVLFVTPNTLPTISNNKFPISSTTPVSSTETDFETITEEFSKETEVLPDVLVADGAVEEITNSSVAKNTTKPDAIK